MFFFAQIRSCETENYIALPFQKIIFQDFAAYRLNIMISMPAMVDRYSERFSYEVLYFKMFVLGM